MNNPRTWQTVADEQFARIGRELVELQKLQTSWFDLRDKTHAIESAIAHKIECLMEANRFCDRALKSAVDENRRIAEVTGKILEAVS